MAKKLPNSQNIDKNFDLKSVLKLASMSLKMLIKTFWIFLWTWYLSYTYDLCMPIISHRITSILRFCLMMNFHFSRIISWKQLFMAWNGTQNHWHSRRNSCCSFAWLNMVQRWSSELDMSHLSNYFQIF